MNKKIKEEAFKKTKIDNFDFTGISEIEEHAFEGCKNLKYVNLENVQKIGVSAFLYCSGLEAVTLNDQVYINDYAFSCTAIKSIILKSKTIEVGVFDECSKLKNLVLENTIEIRTKAFKDCKSLEIVKIPKTCKEIWSRAFEGCTNLKELHIPKGVEIGSFAFRNCPNLTILQY